MYSRTSPYKRSPSMDSLGRPKLTKKDSKKTEKNEKEKAFMKRKPPIAPLSPEKVDHRETQNELSWSQSNIMEKSQTQIDPFFRHVSNTDSTDSFDKSSYRAKEIFYNQIQL